MAYAEIEPFGELVADMRHGEATRVLAECNRNPAAKPDPYKGSDFIYWRPSTESPEDDEPILLADPVEHSNLLRAALFGAKPKRK